MRLLHYFWNNLSRTSSMNGYSNVINGNKHIKSCEFCVLHRECCEVAKKLWFWWNIVYQLYEKISSNQKCLYYKIIFSLTTSVLSLKVSFRRVKFVYLYSSFVYTMSVEALHCIESAMFLSSKKHISFGSFVNKG